MKDTPIDSSPKDSGGGGSNDPSNRDDDILVRVGLLPPGHQPLHLAQREDNEKTSIVIRYVEDVDEFRQLSELRRKGWESTDGDKAFQTQRQRADNLAQDVSKFNYDLMGKIANELHLVTGAFKMTPGGPKKKGRVLDLCAAPGGFLNTAMRLNSGCDAMGFSLDPKEGGYSNLLSPFRKRCMKFLDVTMLAADMGVAEDEIPIDHPDADKFLPRQIEQGDYYDLVLCDGNVLRTQDRSSGAGKPSGASSDDNDSSKNTNKTYRDLYENYRLKYVQLALGLEHLQPGGTMVVLLHKVEMWNTLCTIRRFARFSDRVHLYKPRVSHTTRSSFYMVAQGVNSAHPDAVAAVAKWKAV
ncbi:uncharacterized protein PG998_012141 [Apiospora kogelbergensis]|uniref:uncharacterized protein n=1 Tax=Apiospora kogelbergensis TaxID=1337665 RepID=UPI0031326FEB